MRFIATLFLLVTSIPTANVDINRTNANTAEFLITPAVVANGNLKLRGSYPVDGYMLTQPLYVPGITIGGIAHDLVIVVTLNNSVYAFDGNTLSQTPIWRNLTFAPIYASPPVSDTTLYGKGIGCISTPAADAANLKLYVVCDTFVSGTPNWVIRQLDLTTGSTLITTTISGQVVGTGDVGHGDTTSGANLLFFPEFEFNRASLALANGNVYVGFAAITDTRPYHGWLMAYSTSSLAQTAIWCSSPNGWGGGIWMADGAPAIDGSGNVYVTTGNGTDYDGATTFTNSTLKFGATLSMLDWFEPSNNASINAVDADISSNRFILIPGTGLGVTAGKDFNVYSIDTTCMGHLQGSSGCTLQSFKTNASGSPGGSSGSYGAAFMNNILYLPVTTGGLYAFSFSGTFNTTPTLLGNSYGFPGPAQIMGSINGTSNGILWVATVASGTHTQIEQGILRALNPITLAEYWNSSTSGTDTLGNLAKFVAPTVSNGRVFVATQDSKVQIYAVLPSEVMRGQAKMRGVAIIR